MKKIFYIAVAALVLFAANSCKDKKTTPVISANDSLEVEEDMADTTIYGVCGEGTTMHELQLITDTGDTINAFIDDTAPNIINLTSLLGKWTSLDKNFEIIEGGEVKNNVKAEQNPWTSWKILNGKLLLNKDTFQIDNLGSDSLMLENNQGIFVFKRYSEEAESKSE